MAYGPTKGYTIGLRNLHLLFGYWSVLDYGACFAASIITQEICATTGNTQDILASARQHLGYPCGNATLSLNLVNTVAYIILLERIGRHTNLKLDFRGLAPSREATRWGNGGTRAIRYPRKVIPEYARGQRF